MPGVETPNGRANYELNLMLNARDRSPSEAGINVQRRIFANDSESFREQRRRLRGLLGGSRRSPGR